VPPRDFAGGQVEWCHVWQIQPAKTLRRGEDLGTSSAMRLRLTALRRLERGERELRFVPTGPRPEAGLRGRHLIGSKVCGWERLAAEDYQGTNR